MALNMAVCVKRIPKTAEADIIIRKDGKDIEKGHLAFALNDWDGYAVREAVSLREKHGGAVTVVTVDTDDSREILARCLAMGADRAIRIEPPREKDNYLVSQILYRTLKDRHFDLIMTGVQAEDDNCAQIGPSLAQMLGIPHATIVNHIEVLHGCVRAKRELEGGVEEVLELRLPALLTIQTGINEPKYVSLAAILEAEEKEIEEIALDSLGLENVQNPAVEVNEVFFPPARKTAEILRGAPSEVAERVLAILKKKIG